MARAWDNANFTYRREIRIDPTNVGSNQANFPLLVVANDDDQIDKTHIGGSGYWAFYDHNGTKLSWDVETISEGASYTNFTIWVGVPVVYTSPTGEQNKIWMYYDPSTAEEENEPTEVWTDAGYKAVYHLNEGSGELYDSTGLGHSLTAYNTPTYDATGKVGKCLTFNGANEYLLASAVPVAGQPCTLEAWLKPSADALMTVVYIGDINNRDRMRIFAEASNDRVRGGVEESADYDYAEATNAWTLDAWSYAVMTVGASNAITIVLDADFVHKGTASPSAAPTDFDTVTVAVTPYDTNSKYMYWSGSIDEVRIANSVKTDAWINFVHKNVNEADFELAWQAEEEGGEPPSFVPYPYPRGLRGGMTPNLSGGLLT